MNGGGANSGANTQPGQKPDDFDANRYSLVGSDNDDENPMRQSIVSTGEYADTTPTNRSGYIKRRKYTSTNSANQSSIIESRSDIPQYFKDASFDNLNSSNQQYAKAHGHFNPKIILSITIAVLVIGTTGIIAILLLSPNKSTTTTFSTLAEHFTEYANLALTGSATGQADNDCIENNNCYFQTTLKSEENFKSYFESTKGIKDKIKNDLATLETNNDEDKDIAEMAQQQIYLHEFLQMYHEKPILKKNDIVLYYVKNGSSEATKYINSYYDYDKNNTYSEILKDRVEEMGQAVIRNLHIYEKLGCLAENVDEKCFYENSSEAEKARVAENNKLIANYGAKQSTYRGYYEAYTINIVTIINKLNQTKESD